MIVINKNTDSKEFDNATIITYTTAAAATSTANNNNNININNNDYRQNYRVKLCRR